MTAESAMPSLDDGTWLVMHPEELIATFFLPLVEPLGIPQGFRFPTHVPISPLAPSGLDKLEAICNLQGISGESSRGEVVELSAEQWSAVRNWSNKVVLSSSIVVFHVSADPLAMSGVGAALVVAQQASSERFSADVLLSTSSLPEVPIELAEGAGIGQITVLEVAVPLRLLGNIPRLDDVISATGIVAGPDAGIDKFDYRRASEGKDLSSTVVEERLYAALHTAVGDVRSVQRAYSVVANTPVTLLTRTRLPAHIPITIRRLNQIGSPEHGERVILWVNNNFWQLLRPIELSEEEISQIAHARTKSDVMGPFDAYLNLRGEAMVAHHRHGDTRVAALLLGLAAEALLDDLILHLQWEACLTPEGAAAQWVDGLVTRIRRELPARLGGDWDITGTGPVGEWSKNVAELRNRVAHGAYEPSIDEVATSGTTLERLVSFLGDRLCDQSVLRNYPRTAFIIAGEAGLRSRNAFTRRIRELLADGAEPRWDITFSRWRAAHQRLRRDRSVEVRRPSVADAVLVAVLRDGTRTLTWCLHDRAAAMAAIVSVDPNSIPPRIQNAINEGVGRYIASSSTEPVSMAFEPRGELVAHDVGQWVEEYHYVPLAGVMRDRSDFAR